MAKNKETDIDYQYPDEQLAAESELDFQQGDTFSEKKPGLLSRFPKKKIIIFFVVLAVLFSVFQILTQKEKKAATVQPEIVEKAEKVEAPRPQARVIQPARTAQEVPAVQPKVNLVPTSSAATNDDLAQLESQIQGINQEIAGIKEAMATMVNTVGVLASQVQELRSAQQTSPSTFRPFKPKVSYYLKAVIPGRAWLESSNGNLLTVKEGDSLPEYGTINKIDSNEGWLETSSGLVITYGKNDS